MTKPKRKPAPKQKATPSSDGGSAAGPRASALRAALLAGGGIIVTVLVITVPLFVFPSTASLEDVRAGGAVDAVLVLGGGSGRIETALELVSYLPEPPPTLLLSVPYGWPLVTCGSAPDLPRVEVECFEPVPLTTAGEMAKLGALVAERGWDRVVVVTSDFHVTRSRRLAERCVAAASTDTELLFVAAASNPLSLHGSFAIATEWPSYLGTAWDHQPSCQP
jgi:hypothetical protein